MGSPRINMDEIMSKTVYFKSHLEKLLIHLHPVFVCPDMIMKILIHGPSGCGKTMLVRAAAKTLNLKLFEEDMNDMLGDNIVATDEKIRSNLAKLSTTEPCLILITSCELLCYFEEQELNKIEHAIAESLKELSKKSTQPIILIAETNDFNKFSKTSFSSIFHETVALVPPVQSEAEEIVEMIRKDAEIDFDVTRVLRSISKEGKKHYIGNILHAFSKAEVAHCTRVQSGIDDRLNDGADEEGTRWLDIGGLDNVKKEIIDTLQLPIDYPQLKKSGLGRTGILLYGPPGTGKTLLAKAVATECNCKFFNVKGPELLSEYVGQSEDNVRRLFQKARDASPSIIFFDEIDSLAPNRGQAGDSGGVMDRVVSQLLAELDKAGQSDDVYVIGATNRVDILDPALLTSGRFDKILELPLATSSEDRLQILKALTRKMVLAQDVDLCKLESLAPPNMSGADFQGLCSQALQKTIDKCIELLEAGKATEDELEIVTCMEDFLESLQGC